MDSSLSLTALLRGEPGGPNYLAYLNRSDVDMLRGLFWRLVRVIISTG
jgi:hypothetical protein